MARVTRKADRLGGAGDGRSPGCSSGSLATATGGTPDPTDPNTHLSHFAVVLDSGILVLREGLETILVLAVLTASMRGADSAYRKPLALGAATAFGVAIVTWFVAIAITDAVGPGKPRPPGGDRAAGDRGPAGGHELVLSPRLLDRLDRAPQPAPQGDRRRRRLGERPANAARAGAARLHLGVPRGLRGRPVPAEPAAALRLGRRARGRRAGAGVRGGDRLPDVRPAAPAAVPQDARRDRRDARRRAAGDGRRERAGAPAGRAGSRPRRCTSRSPAGWGCGSRSSPTSRRSSRRLAGGRCWSSAPTSWPRSSRCAVPAGAVCSRRCAPLRHRVSGELRSEVG